MQTELGDAGSTPVQTGRVVVERPPPGLARGKYAWPAWGVGLLGGSTVILGLVAFVLLARRRRGR